MSKIGAIKWLGKERRAQSFALAKDKDFPLVVSAAGGWKPGGGFRRVGNRTAGNYWSYEGCFAYRKVENGGWVSSVPILSRSGAKRMGMLKVFEPDEKALQCGPRFKAPRLRLDWRSRYGEGADPLQG